MQTRRVSVAIITTALIVALGGPARGQSIEDITGPFKAIGDFFRQLPAELDRGPTGPLEPVFDLLAGTCDPTDQLRCVLPFPNDRFTTPAATPTGLRVDLPLAGMPRNVAGKPIDPTEWNRNDGFSPGSMGLTFVAGLDLQRTFGLPDDVEAQIRVPSLSLTPNAPIVLLDAVTGQRHSYWAELDTHPDTTDAGRLLIIRPLTNLVPGHRYVMGLRNLRDSEGQLIEAGREFAEIRDSLPPTACPPRRPDHAGEPGRPPHAGQPGRPPHSGPPDCPEDLPGEPGRYKRMFGDLRAAGVDTRELYLAWDFTVASSENLTSRALAMRDETFAMLGDADLTDGVVSGQAPEYRITSIEHRGDDLAIRGTITAPNYLTLPQDLPRVPPHELGTGVEQTVPGSRLFYGTLTPHPMATPKVNPLAPTVQAHFACFLPNQATAADPATPTLYGHGLLGGLSEVGGGSTSLLRVSNFLICGTPWIGMSTEDVANVATIIADASQFPTLPDRAQQGFLHFHLLGRLMIHPQGFAADPAFQDDAGNPRIDPTRLVYDGNSQGGIMGGALTALAPDFRHAVLGVPGGNYSTLLNRSVDWEGAYGEVAYATYPNKTDQQLLFALIQMLWDRAETNGYAHAMTDRPLPNTLPHRVLLHLAYADHQVANVAAEVDARTVGARLLQTSLAPGRHWADVSGQRAFGLEVFDLDATTGLPLPHAGSAIVYIDSGNEMPPHGNVPPRDGTDPHSDPRRDPFAHAQRVQFLRSGVVHDTRQGQSYWSQQCRGPHNPEAC